MEKFNKLEKGTTFTAINLRTKENVLCKKINENYIYIYTYHDFSGFKKGGFRISTKDFLSVHDI